MPQLQPNFYGLFYINDARRQMPIWAQATYANIPAYCTEVFR
jgi:hypothetical protein